jgi:hypothetical protein
MQIIKQKRTYWRVEPGSTARNYATLELTAAYNAHNEWQHGWHVRLRNSAGTIISHCGVYPTKDAAATAATALLTR